MPAIKPSVAISSLTSDTPFEMSLEYSGASETLGRAIEEVGGRVVRITPAEGERSQQVVIEVTVRQCVHLTFLDPTSPADCAEFLREVGFDVPDTPEAAASIEGLMGPLAPIKIKRDQEFRAGIKERDERLATDAAFREQYIATMSHLWEEHGGPTPPLPAYTGPRPKKTTVAPSKPSKRRGR